MSDFNGKSNHIVGLFLVEDFLLTNTMLYLLWCAYVPVGSSFIFEKEDIHLAADESVFVSSSQQKVFVTYVIMFTLLTIVPQVVCSFAISPSYRYSKAT